MPLTDFGVDNDASDQTAIVIDFENEFRTENYECILRSGACLRAPKNLRMSLTCSSVKYSTTDAIAQMTLRNSARRHRASHRTAALG